MRKQYQEIIALTAKEVLLSLVDLTTPFYEASRLYRVSTRKYLAQRSIDRSNFLERIGYLRRQGLIETFVKRKEKFIELTPKGLKRIKQINDNELIIERAKKWDGKWRTVVFDIPNKKKNARDNFRIKLLQLGFEKVQESIYVHPFECSRVITELSEQFSIERDVLIMISEIMQGEDKIIAKFLDKKILEKKDLTLR